MNLLQLTTINRSEEDFATILQHEQLRIERIVSTGQQTPPGEWYDQAWDEWVLLLQGEAGLRLEGEAGTRELQAGDHCFLPARCRHRVEWTRAEPPTIWLAIHYQEPHITE